MKKIIERLIGYSFHPQETDSNERSVVYLGDAIHALKELAERYSINIPDNETTAKEDLVALVLCSNCGEHFINPDASMDQQTHDPDEAEVELKFLVDLSDSGISHDVSYFYGCPNCETTDYLIKV